MNTTTPTPAAELLSDAAIAQAWRDIAEPMKGSGHHDDFIWRIERLAQQIEATRELPASAPKAEGVSHHLEIAETALQAAHDKFMERQHIDPGTGYPEYGSQENYYLELCAALDAVKELQDVPADPREQEYEP